MLFRCVVELSARVGSLAVADGVARADVIAGEAACALAAVKPFGRDAEGDGSVVGGREGGSAEGDVAHGTRLHALAAMDAAVFIDAELAVADHVAVEIFAYDVCEQPRRGALLQIFALLAVSYPLGKLRNVIPRCGNFALLHIMRVGVHKWQAYVGVGHLHRGAEVEFYTLLAQLAAEDAERVARLVAAGAYGEDVSALEYRRRQRLHVAAKELRRLPSVYREGEAYGFVGTLGHVKPTINRAVDILL